MRTLRTLSACLLILLPLTARAQMDSREAIDLQNQIAELRQELQAMQSAQQAGNQSPPTYAPQPEPAYPSQVSPQPGGRQRHRG